MKTKKRMVFLFAILLLLPMLCGPAHAEDSPEFRYELTVNGEDIAEVNTGDIITVTLYLHRTDAEEPFTLYGMQSEIQYDGEFFELVQDSITLYPNVSATDIAVGGGMREFYMYFISYTGGAQWKHKTRIGSFQLRVIGTEGTTTITNEDFLVTTPYHSGNENCESNMVTAILTSECLVRFETNGGTPIEPQSVVFGEKITPPQAPEREGMRFAGWYRDIFLTEAWDFDTDIVEGNMRLYAKWEEVETETETETDPPETEPETETDPVETETETQTEPETETDPPETEPEVTEPETTEPDETVTDPETETETETETEKGTETETDPVTQPPETETGTETETDPPETETQTESQAETDPPVTEIEPGIETEPPTVGSETETTPGPKPEKPKQCLLCGNLTHSFLCTRCSIVLWAGFCLIALLLFALIMYFYFRFYNKDKNQ